MENPAVQGRWVAVDDEVEMLNPLTIEEIPSSDSDSDDGDTPVVIPREVFNKKRRKCSTSGKVIGPIKVAFRKAFRRFSEKFMKNKSNKKKILVCKNGNSAKLPRQAVATENELDAQQGSSRESDNQQQDHRQEGSSLCDHATTKEESGMYIAICDHGLCKTCIKSKATHITEIENADSPENIYNFLSLKLLCPWCNVELSKTDILEVLGSNFLQTYKSFLEKSYTNIYGDDTICIKCLKKEGVKKNYRNKGKGKPKDRQDTVHFPLSRGCSTCKISWCIACGMHDCHACKEAENFKLYKILSELESIRNELIGTVKSTEKGATEKSVISDEIKSVGMKAIVEDIGTSDSIHNTPEVEPSSKGMGALEKFFAPPPPAYVPFNMFPYNKETVWKAGTGFGGGRGDKVQLNKMKKVEKAVDDKVKDLLATLISILNNNLLERSQAYLTFSAYVLLWRDQILIQLLEYYMSNDSMMDICERSEVYNQLASIVTTMKDFPELLSVLMGPSGYGGKNENGSCNYTFMKKMKNIYEQSSIILKKFEGKSIDKEVEQDVEIAKCLLNCYNALTTAVKEVSDKMHVGSSVNVDSSSPELSYDSASEPEEQSSKSGTSGNLSLDVAAYKESLKPLQFLECPLNHSTSSSSSSHNFSGAVRKVIDNSGIHNKKRMMYIAKDLACLSTSLPLEWESSIHVRVDPVKTELLKALIIGPKGTPYQNGVFLFDILLPPDYPQVPPSVTFLTTGQGQVRFNPNLYQCGKVCLSLLGTWDGPGWQPWNSTLLQVLVSIQSLIFVAEPYYNEPGHEMTNYHEAAEEENRQHRYNTLRLAIRDAMRSPDPSFKDVILKHFQHKKAEITSQCFEWMELQAAVKSKFPMKDSFDKLKDEIITELMKLP